GWPVSHGYAWPLLTRPHEMQRKLSGQGADRACTRAMCSYILRVPGWNTSGTSRNDAATWQSTAWTLPMLAASNGRRLSSERTGDGTMGNVDGVRSAGLATVCTP